MTGAPAREVDPGRALAAFGIASALLLVWMKVPPSVMAARLLDRPVDSLWPNVVACGVLVVCAALMDVSP